MNQYVSCTTVCPFAIKEEHQKLHCEGFQKGTIIHTWFKTKELLNAHRKSFCSQIKGYPSCPIYQASCKQYEVNEDESE